MPLYLEKSLDWKNATPEQINLFRHVDNLIAWNTITPLFVYDLIAGSEFETYAATKLYLALELEFGAFATVDNPEALEAVVSFHDENDNVSYGVTNVSLAYNATTFGGWMNTIILKNQYFGCIEANPVYLYIKFNGYRLDII